MNKLWDVINNLGASPRILSHGDETIDDSVGRFDFCCECIWSKVFKLNNSLDTCLGIDELVETINANRYSGSYDFTRTFVEVSDELTIKIEIYIKY